MALDPKFTKFTTASPILVNFDFTDIAEGTGVVNLLAGGTANNSGNTYTLSRNAFFANESNVAVNTTSGSATELADLDFDLLSFNLPKTLTGTMLYNIPVTGNIITSDRAISCYVIVKVRHVTSGGSESEIVSSQTETIAKGTGAGFNEVFANKIVIPETHFKEGETLRITLGLWVWRSAGASEEVAVRMYFDPKNRSVASIVRAGVTIAASVDTTTTNFLVPFKLNI